MKTINSYCFTQLLTCLRLKARIFNRVMHLLPILLLALVLFCGCFTVPKEEIEINRYSINNPLQFAPSDTILPLALRISPFTADALYRGNRMIYRDNRGQTNHYYYHRWLAPPEDQLADILHINMLQWALFGNGVFQTENGLIPTHEIRCRLKSLNAINIKKNYAAELAIEVQLLRINPRNFIKKLVLQKIYELKVKRKNDKVDTFVSAVDTLAGQWLKQLRDDMYDLMIEEAKLYK